MTRTGHRHRRTLRGTNSSSSNVLPPRLRLIVHVAVQGVLSAMNGVATWRSIGAMVLYHLITVVHRPLGIMNATVEPPLAWSPRRDGHSVLPPARPNFHSRHRCVGCRGGCNTLHHGGRSRAPHRFFSCVINSAQRNYCPTRRELLVVIAGLQHCRHYLVGATVILCTDHYSLKWLRTFKRPEGILARWIETLAKFDYTVEHRPDRLHSNADGCPGPSVSSAMTGPTTYHGSMSWRGRMLQSAHGRSTCSRFPRN